MENSRKSNCSDLQERIADVLLPALPAGSSILLGLSGGIDSIVLLHILHQLSISHSWHLSALHVHHGISPHADAWATFCAGLCAHHGIPFQVEHVDIAPLREHGIEAAARKLRHEALARQPVDYIALAHHQDDQAETLLLQLLRGAGVKGVSAMPVLKQRSGAPALLRPLLNVSRAELLDYAKQHNLQWVEDESNADDLYPRNFLRHRVLPLLEQRFPSCRNTLARSARHFAEASDLLGQLARQDAGLPSHASGEEGELLLEVVRLQSLSQPRAKNLLRWFLHQRGARMPESSRLEEMLRQLCHARSDATVQVVFGDWQIRCYRGRVYALPLLPEPDADMCVPWHAEEELELPQLGGRLQLVHCTGEGLSLAKLKAAPVTIRLRHGEERLRPDAARPARTLKYLFQERDVPPWKRARWPLVYCGETLVAAPGVAMAAEFLAESGEPGVRVCWCDAGN